MNKTLRIQFVVSLDRSREELAWAYVSHRSGKIVRFMICPGGGGWGQPKSSSRDSGWWPMSNWVTTHPDLAGLHLSSIINCHIDGGEKLAAVAGICTSRMHVLNGPTGSRILAHALSLAKRLHRTCPPLSQSHVDLLRRVQRWAAAHPRSFVLVDFPTRRQPNTTSWSST